MNIRGQKGFALALALFIATGVLTAMSAGFLGMTRLQMQMARSSEKIKAHWIAAAMLEAAIYEFEAERKLSGTNVVNIDDEVLEDIGDEVLAQARLAWADPGQVDLDTPSGRGRYEKSIQITKEFVDGGYDYWIETYAKDSVTKADNVIRQRIRLYRGSIFDFGVFYEDDLEITPGADMEIQGPIFSNGNIYLMSPMAVDPDDPYKLRIETPESGGFMDYAVKSAGNIYFYNKPFLGRNYMLDSPLYANRLPSFYKHEKQVELTRKGQPLIYFPRNAVLNNWNNKDGKWWVEESCFKEIDSINRDCGHHIELKSGIKVERLKFPSIHYDRSVYWSAHDTWDFPTHSLSMSLYTNLAYPFENSPAQKYMSFSADTTAMNLKLSALSYDELFPSGSNDFSFSGTINPGWNGAKTAFAGSASFGKRIIDDQLPRIEIDLGKFDAANADNHLIIEPITNLSLVSSVDTDPQFFDDPRLATKADVIFFCTDTSCATVRARLTAPDNAQVNPDDDVIITAIQDLGVTAGRCFDDKRLGARVHVLRVNLRVLTDALLNVSPQKVYNREDAVVAYFETKSLKSFPLTASEISGFNNSSNVSQASTSCSGPIRAVEFYNGIQAPVGGMSLITNGRAWLQLDGDGVDIHFNNKVRDAFRSDCGDGSWPNCDLPPVAFFSDSFGVDTHEVNVSRDHKVNAAIVSGYVPSQLEKVYEGCDGTLANMSKCDVRRDDMVSHSGGDIWLYPQGGTYFPAGAWYNVVDCPSGLNLSTGEPNDSQNCFSYWDSSTGIYYLRRAWIYQWFYKRMVSEYDDYDGKLTSWAAKPAGVGNVYKEFSPYLAALPVFDVTMKTAAEATISGLLNGSEDFSAANALATLKANLPGLLDASGVFKTQSPLFKGSTLLLAYEVRPPSDPYAGSIFKDASNLSGANNPWLWVPVGSDEKLKNPDVPTSDLLVNSYDPAANYNFIHQGRYYKFYWREPWFDFGMVPEWKIPMNLTGLVGSAENNYKYKNSISDLNWLTGARVASTSRNVYYKNNPADADPGVLYLRSHELVYPSPEAAVPPLPGMLQFVIDPIRMTGMKTTGRIRTCSGVTPIVPGDETSDNSGGGETGCTDIYVDAIDAVREHEIAWKADQPHRHNMNAVYGGYLTYNWSGYALPLYQAKFSGGYENLINLQNNWRSASDRKTIYFSGTMTAPWFSRELLKSSSKPAFYSTDYYTAPIRKFDYDESLSTEPPPAAPSTYTIARTDYEEGYRK